MRAIVKGGRKSDYDCIIHRFLRFATLFEVIFLIKRKDGTLEARINLTINGKTIRKSFYGHTEKEVLEKINQYKIKEDEGLPFEKVADLYWAFAEKHLAVNSLRNYKPALERANYAFAGTPIKRITTADIRRFLERWIADEKPARKTAETQRQVIRNVYQYGINYGYCDNNPATNVDLPSKLPPKRKRELPMDKDIKAVKNGLDAPFGLFAYMALFTGIRHGELLALNWSDIDLDNREITVNKSVYYEGNQPRLKSPKTEAGKRVVPILDALFPVLKAAKKKKGLLFPNGKGQIMSETEFQAAWAKYVKATGVTCTPHQLRHAFATMLFESGISAMDAKDILGHAQASTTEDIYTHIRESRRKQIAQKIYSANLSV